MSNEHTTPHTPSTATMRHYAQVCEMLRRAEALRSAESVRAVWEQLTGRLAQLQSGAAEQWPGEQTEVAAELGSYQSEPPPLSSDAWVKYHQFKMDVFTEHVTAGLPGAAQNLDEARRELAAALASASERADR